MIPDAFPLPVREPNHSTFIADRQPAGNFEIGSNRYWPRQFDEIEGTPQTWINEPVPPDNVRSIGRARRRPLHAVLCEALTNTQALLTRLEAGVTVPRQEQREIIRLLYVATRHQVQALAAALELEGLE
jgi:hypothetical protein